MVVHPALPAPAPGEKVLPKWSKQPSRLASHDELPSRGLSPRPFLGGFRTHHLGAHGGKVATSAARRGWKPAFPARHSLYDDRGGALASRYVCPSRCSAGSVAKCAQARSLASPRGAIVAPAAVTDRGFGCHPSTLESILLINGTAAFCVC